VLGYVIEDEVQALVSMGARLLEKPFKLEALEAEVKRALNRFSERVRAPRQKRNRGSGS